jgi:hypothetical protein
MFKTAYANLASELGWMWSRFTPSGGLPTSGNIVHRASALMPSKRRQRSAIVGLEIRMTPISELIEWTHPARRCKAESIENPDFE